MGKDKKQKKPAYVSFAEEIGPLLWDEILRQGVLNPRTAFRNMAMQLGYESLYGTTRLARELNNFGGVGYNDKTNTYHSYKDKKDFVLKYVKLMNSRYKNAIGSPILTEYAKGIRLLGYYTDTLENYANNLNGMKSYLAALANHMLLHPELYPEKILVSVDRDGNKVMTFPKPNWAVEESPFTKHKKILPEPINTDYSMKRDVPELYDAMNAAGSPAYGGYNPRIPTIREINNKRKKEIEDIFERNAVAYGYYKGSLLPSIPELITKGKEDYVASVMGSPSMYNDYAPEYPKLITPKLSKGKDLPKFNPGKDNDRLIQDSNGNWVRVSDNDTSRTFEGIVVTPSGNRYHHVPKVDNSEEAVKQRDLFLTQHPYGPNTAPVEPGLELTFPEFDLLTLVSGVGNLGSKAVKETEDILGSPFVYKDVGYDIAKSPYFKDIYGKYFSREELAKRALRSKAPQIDGFEGLPSYIKGNKFYGVDHDELPEDMYNLVKQSSYNRLRSKRPWMSDLEFDRQFENALKGGYSEYPDETFITAGYPENAGLLFPSNNHIAIRNGYVEHALPHEVRHRMQQVFPHTQEEEDLMAPVFGEWWNGLPEKYPNLSKITSDINAEIDTSIGDFRRKLIGDNNILRMTKEQLNLFMANTSIEQRRKAAHEANGYMRAAYGDKLATSLEEADKWVNQLVNLAQELGVYTTPVVGSAALYNSMKDSGILPNHKNGKDLPKYGGGIGMMGIPAMPGYMIEKNPTVAEIASYLPLIGTVMDVKAAVKNPTAENIGYAALSGITDLVGGKLISKIAKKAIGKKKLFKEAYKSAKTEYELWPYYKNMDPKEAKYKIDYMAKRKAQKSAEDAFGISDFMEDDLNNLILYGNLGAVYGPDFMANMYLQANKK